MENTKENKKVVIVEDDRLLSIVLKKMARSLNFDVLDVAHGGKDAIRAIEKHKPDLILMDIFLADEVNGIDAMRQIREHSDTPVIYITAQSDMTIRQQASNTENSFFMLKPVNLMELKSAVEEVQYAA